jgi:hypothetical protein
MMVLVLRKCVAPNPPTEPALKPEFDWVVVLVLPEWLAPKPTTKLALALKPELDEVSKLAGMVHAWVGQNITPLTSS